VNATGFDPAAATTLLGRRANAPEHAPNVSAVPGLWQPAPGTALWPGEAPIPRALVSADCAGQFAPHAPRPADPFGIFDLPSLWPANAVSPEKPRPWPVGPAYNSSEFRLFINTSYVVLVRPAPSRAACRHAGVHGLHGNPAPARWAGPGGSWGTAR